MARLFAKYKEEVVPALKEKFQYKNAHQIPRLETVVLNMGLGEAARNPKILDTALNDLRLITGQQPVMRKAKKSIANFKLREGMPIGASVTLRRSHMYEFLDRLVNVALPRVRDFRGVSTKAFDGKVTTLLESTSKLFSQKSIWIRLQLEVLTLLLLQVLKTTKRVRPFLRVLACHLRNKKGYHGN